MAGLSDGSGSGSSEDTVALLTCVPLAFAWTVIVTVLLAPSAMPSRSHVTVPALCAQPGEAETKLMPAGSVSLTVTFVAADGPSLNACSVYVSWLFCVTAATDAVFSRRRSAAGPTSVEALASSSPESGSNSSALACALLTSVCSAAANAARTTSVSSMSSPLASVAVVQLTVPPEPTAGSVQLVPALAVSDTNVMPAGSGSLMTTSCAVDGPSFVAVSVYVASAPASTFAGPLFVSEMSAVGATSRSTLSLVVGRRRRPAPRS